jgi:hypothetical protein
MKNGEVQTSPFFVERLPIPRRYFPRLHQYCKQAAVIVLPGLEARLVGKQL